MPAQALIIEARFYGRIADMLLAGARAELVKRRFEVDVVSVPGVLEVPIALGMAVDSSRRRDTSFLAYVVLGCVIRGQTTHYETVANEGNRKVMDLATDARLALGNGILTVENEAQAIVRADPRQKNKGGSAALAAIALFDLRSTLNR